MDEATKGKWYGEWKTPGNSRVGASPGPGDNLGMFVVHMMLLHTGKVLMYSGGAEVNYVKEVVVWDPLVTVPDPMNPGQRMPDTSASNVTIHQPPSNIDIFCSHHVQLKDGRILILGGASHPSATHVATGHTATGHGTGVRSAAIFDPMETNATHGTHGGSRAFTRLNDMSQARWYPTAVHLQDGKVVVFSGRTDDSNTNIAHTVEIFDPANNYQPQLVTIAPGRVNDTAFKFPTFPGMHLVRGGKVFHTATTWRYEGTIRKPNTPMNNFHYVGNTAVDGVPTLSFQMSGGTSANWQNYASSPANSASTDKNDWLWPNAKDREEGMSILLSPAQDGKILLIGGARPDSQFSNPGNQSFHEVTLRGPGTDDLEISNAKESEVLSTQGSSVSWQSSPAPSGQVFPLTHPRINVNLVNLVDGKVLVLGGHNYYKWEAAGSGVIHSKKCELYDPRARTFTEVAELNEPRMYHSAAVLLPDGSVLVAGGADGNHRESFTFQGDADGNEVSHAGGTTQTDMIELNRKDMEIYKPPYLFVEPNVTPPMINSVTASPTNVADKIFYGRNFTVDCTDHASIKKIVLIRPGSMSHHTDTEQRHIPFTINASEFGFRVVNNRLVARMTNDPSIAPPGYYMVFVIKRNERPCDRARFVKVEPYC